MAQVQQISGDPISTFSAGIGPFIGIAAGGVLDGNTSTEAQAAIPVRSLGTFSLLYLRIVTSSLSNAVYAFRVAGVNGNQTISVGLGTTGEFTDAVNTDAPTAGQTVDLRAAGPGSPVVEVVSVVFAATSNTVGRIGFGGTTAAISISTASTSTFLGVANTQLSTTETDVQTQFTNPCTLQNLAIFCDFKGRSKADTVALRKNAASVTSTVSVTGTGLFEDTTHTDAIVANDKVDFVITTGSGTGTDEFTLWSVEQLTTDNSFQHVSCADGGHPLNFGQTNYLVLSGAVVGETTEADIQVKYQQAGVLSDLGTNISANSVNGTSTLTLRNTAASTAVTLSILSTATGFSTDSTHSATVASGDELNYQLVTGGSSGTILPTSIVTQHSAAAAFSPDEDLWIPPAFMLSEPEITVWQ